MNTKYIVIGGDTVPTESNEELFYEGCMEELVGKEILDLFHNASYRIINLEVSLIDSESPIEKCGPNLSAHTKTAHGLKKLGIDLVTLANNHIMDQGVQGLTSTVDILNNKGINYVGVGKNLETASEPAIFIFSGKKVGVYACAEHEFTIASDDKPGANPFDPLESYDEVKKLKAKVDYVIILYHGGKEHYRYPSPMLQNYCRKFVDNGADLVLCQHSHCIGCEEKYSSGTILYGQGNFVFDYNDSEFWKTGFLVTIDSDFKINYIPIIKSGRAVRMARRETAAQILNDFNSRNEEILIPGRIDVLYDEFARRMLQNYLWALLGRSSIFIRILFKIGGKKSFLNIVKMIWGKNGILAILNYIECECHNELLIRGIKKCCDDM